MNFTGLPAGSCSALAAFVNSFASQQGREADTRLRAFEYRRHAHAAGGADRIQTKAEPFFQSTASPAWPRYVRPAGAEGMTEGDAAADDVAFLAIYGAQRFGQTELRATKSFRLPCTQGTQHSRRDGFVNFVEVEVGERKTGAGEHARDGIGWRHQQPLFMQINRRDFGVVVGKYWFAGFMSHLEIEDGGDRKVVLFSKIFPFRRCAR